MYWDCGFSTSSYQQFMPDEGEMEEFRSEKSVKAGKSPEEIERLSVDEKLSEIERACLLISTGQDVQKVCVIEHLIELTRKHQMECLSKIIPKICEMLPSSCVEIHEAASKIFAELVQNDLIPIHIFTTTCMSAVLAQLDSKDSSISNAWLSMVLSCITHLPKDIVKRHILTTALAKGQLSQTVNSRQASCKIIGALASKFEPYWLKNELLSLATTLCQDVDSGVREVMCQQLNELARGLGLEQTKSSILPELIELVDDEECCVQVAALETLCDLISFLDEATLKTHIVPLVKKFCQRSFNAGDNSLTTVVRLLGRLCDQLKGVMTTDQKTWFIQFYQKLCEYTRPVTASPSSPHRPMSSTQRQLHVEATEDKLQVECRRLCAYNFPAMLLFVGEKSFQSDLLPTLRKLSSDKNWKVKRTIACGFHEIVKFLKKNCLIVCGIYQALLKDTSGEVLLGLVHHLPEVMECFAKAGGLLPDTRQPGLLDFIQPLLSCEQVASKFRQWRLHEQLIANFECLVVCMTSEQLYTKFVPIMFKYITGSCVLPVKHAASRTLCLFIRHIRRQDQREELCMKVIEECGKSSNCRLRLLFIDICDIFLETFSRNFFKEYFFEPVLQLAHDPVVNIRLRLCRILPSLKSTLKLPGDRLLLQQLEQTVRKLISQERDHDASQAIREAVMEMDRIEVAMETLTRRTFFEADLHDQKKEEEERTLLLAEEREKESRDKEKSKKLAKPSSNLKSMPSPRMEHRKGGSQISLGGGVAGSSVGGASPALAHRSIAGKQKGAGLVMKSLSSPPSSDYGGLYNNPSSTSTNSSSSSIGSNSANSSPSPSHASRVRLKSGDKTLLTSSPRTSPLTSKASKVNSSTVTSLSSKPSSSKSKDSVNALSSSRVASSRKKSQLQYGLEYSNSSKSRKRT